MIAYQIDATIPCQQIIISKMRFAPGVRSAPAAGVGSAEPQTELFRFRFFTTEDHPSHDPALSPALDLKTSDNMASTSSPRLIGRASCRKTSNEAVEGASLFIFAVATRPATEKSLQVPSGQLSRRWKLGSPFLPPLQGVRGGIVCQLPGIRCHLNASELRSKQCVRRTRARVSKSVASRARAAVPL